MYNNSELRNIAEKFRTKKEVGEVIPLGEGFINDTFIVRSKQEDKPIHILQRKNKRIFTDVPAMMNNIQIVTEHLKNKVMEERGNPFRETLTVTPMKNGLLYHIDDNGEYWAMCDFIEDTVTHEVADTPYLASQGGYGIGKFQSQLADLATPLENILPGFHDMSYRLSQWDDILQRDPAGRKKDLSLEISWIEERREKMVSLWNLYEKGEIPRRVTHNDTKITNMLFDHNDKVICVIDLDTVMNSMCLNDFGDAIRSYANTGKEDEPELDKVSLDMKLFKAYTEGYVSEAYRFLTKDEVDNLAFSALYITYEQVLRFLMDYIDGDNYYKIKSPDHNLVRTHSQYKLLSSMEEQYAQMRDVVWKEYERRLKERQC